MKIGANLRPLGQDLGLAMGWDRFEKFVLSLSQGTLGLRNLKFRRYGVQGQVQKGIDLAGRSPDGVYTVIQCKDYTTFTAADLAAAVTTFADGSRPFNATRFIVATSANTQTTQIADALAALQDEYPDLDIDLWGAEQINESLRSRADLVARFWSRATADTFCTAAPPTGVPSPPLDRQTQAEQILIGPLNTNDLLPKLREADAQASDSPAVAAGIYGEIARALDSSGFRGHGHVMRGRQLSALRKAELFDEAGDIAGHLATLALHQGDRDTARALSRTLNDVATEAAAKGTGGATACGKHAALIEGALDMLFHPLGEGAHLIAALADVEGSEPVFRLF